jgi:ABC-type polysaccharide/polyol phosphate export permease
MGMISGQIAEAFQDFVKWWKIALFGLKRRHMTTLLGPVWLFLPDFAFIAVVGTVFSAKFAATGASYFAYVATGYVIWVFIADSVGRGGNLFVTEFGRYSQIKTNLFGIILKEVIARSIILLVSLTFYTALIWGISGSVNLTLWPFLGLALLFVNSFMQSYWLSALSARFRDLPPIVASVMRMMFFVTPIFWSADMLKHGIREYILHLNPFYHMMEMVRAPLLTGVADLGIVRLAGFWTLANLVLFLAVAHYLHRRIIYVSA